MSRCYWPTASSFPGCAIVNRGFGGAHISDVQHYCAEVVERYSPKAIFLVDVATPMLGEDGWPREGLFVTDRLHLNSKGYELWNSVLVPRLSSFCEVGEAEQIRR